MRFSIHTNMKLKGSRLRRFCGVIVMAGILVPATSGHLSAGSPQQVLTGKELRALLPGVFVGTLNGSWKLKIQAKRDGTIVGWAVGRKDHGKWVIRKNMLCVAWNSWTSGKSKCTEVAKSGNWLEANSVGKLRLRKI